MTRQFPQAGDGEQRTPILFGDGDERAVADDGAHACNRRG